MSTSKTLSLVEDIKAADEDFEWYPTTDEMISVVQNDIKKTEMFWNKKPSILDCGAGDGRVLSKLEASERYAIEKSTVLISQMDENIYIVGADFTRQTLIDKKVDVIFCNPPYSEFKHWMKKIIREANAKFLYFVVPTRWVSDESIKEDIELREAEYSVIDTSDFLDADRKARAVVDVVKVTLCDEHRFHSHMKTDPFDIWFDESFQIGAEKPEKKDEKTAGLKEEIKGRLVKGDNIVPVLEELYNKELGDLMESHKALERIDAVMLRELGVSKSGVCGALRGKISELKNIYWNELFSNLDKITSRLAKQQRKAMLSRLTSHVNVDFNANNAYAVVIWAIRNANHYYDQQLIELVERMTQKACVKEYASNKKTFGDECWRYNDWPTEELTHYQLELRVVLSRVGGISTSDWGWENTRYNGLTESAFDFINDIRTVANNLGYDTTDYEKVGDFEWESNVTREFRAKNMRQGKEVTLMSVKAFKNGNLHIKFNSDFMRRLNVEFGRLKGWLKSKQEAAKELSIPETEVHTMFNANTRLSLKDVRTLANPETTEAA